MIISRGSLPQLKGLNYSQNYTGGNIISRGTFPAINTLKPYKKPVIATPKQQTQPQPNFFQQAEQGITNFFGNAASAIKNEFTPRPVTKPVNVGKITPTALPVGLKVDFVNPSQNASAAMKVTPKSLKQQEQSVKATQKILDPINKQIELTKQQIGEGFSELTRSGGGIVPNMDQVAPKKEYMTQKAYDQAVKNSKSTTFMKGFNSFLGTTVATAHLML